MKEEIRINLDESLIETINYYEKELSIKKDIFIEKALINYFDTLDEMVCDKRIDNLKNDKSEVYSLNEVFNECGININNELN